MKFTAIALAGLATVAMASPAAEANPAPQPEAAADPAFSSWGKKYNPHLWNGWGDAPGQVYRREANPAFSSWGKKYNPHLWNGWGDAPGQVYRREANPAFSSWGKKYNPHLWNGWGDAPGQVYRREAEATSTASTTGTAKPAETGITEEEEKANFNDFERRDPAFSSWGKKYNPHLWNGWGDAPGQVY
ncbi:hypothetical protein KCU98_g6544, partial [Aureobasidium melanogenum]